MKLIDVAEAEVGYLEKASAKDLDSKTANTGAGNFTKYWRDMLPSFQGQAWCDCFVDWCFMKAYGREEADRLQCGGCGEYYTPTSAQKYKDAGRWSPDPIIGAQVFFKNSERICHTGIVVSFTGDSITTIEGNTSGAAGVIANGGGVFKKSYSRADRSIAGYGLPLFSEVGMIYTTQDIFLDEVRKVYLMAHNGHYKYDDSHAMPPGADNKMSCERLPARAMYNLGWTDQRAGGFVLSDNNIETYLMSKGATKIVEATKIKKGDIVVFRRKEEPKPTWRAHAFVAASDYRAGRIDKYDLGDQWRFDAAQPFKNVPFNEWESYRTFYCAFRLPQKPKTEGKIAVAQFKKGAKGANVKLAQILLRGRGYLGADGKKLTLDGEAGTNTIKALKKFQKVHGMKQTGICDLQTWKKLTGRIIRATSATAGTIAIKEFKKGNTGAHIKMARIILRGRGYLGADKKRLQLIAKADANCIAALNKFQEKHKMTKSTKCSMDCWAKLTGKKVV